MHYQDINHLAAHVKLSVSYRLVSACLTSFAEEAKKKQLIKLVKKTYIMFDIQAYLTQTGGFFKSLQKYKFSLGFKGEKSRPSLKLSLEKAYMTKI